MRVRTSGVRRAGWFLGLSWVLWCFPAGALAGVGLIEFNWGGAPYDGGFAGDLMFFGAFLALGQAPFIALCVRTARSGDQSPVSFGATVSLAAAWVFCGLFGWVVGSYLEVGLQTPLYSGAAVLAGVLPWFCAAALEALVLVVALNIVPTGPGLASGAIWVVAAASGGLLYECWRSLDIAAGQNPIKDAIGSYLQSLGAAENVAFEVVPLALSLPLLYGVPTGLALVKIRDRVARRAGRNGRVSRPSGSRDPGAHS